MVHLRITTSLPETRVIPAGAGTKSANSSTSYAHLFTYDRSSCSNTSTSDSTRKSYPRPTATALRASSSQRTTGPRAPSPSAYPETPKASTTASSKRRRNSQPSFPLTLIWVEVMSLGSGGRRTRLGVARGAVPRRPISLRRSSEGMWTYSRARM